MIPMLRVFSSETCRGICAVFVRWVCGQKKGPSRAPSCELRFARSDSYVVAFSMDNGVTDRAPAQRENLAPEAASDGSRSSGARLARFPRCNRAYAAPAAGGFGARLVAGRADDRRRVLDHRVGGRRERLVRGDQRLLARHRRPLRAERVRAPRRRADPARAGGACDGRRRRPRPLAPRGGRPDRDRRRGAGADPPPRPSGDRRDRSDRPQLRGRQGLGGHRPLPGGDRPALLALAAGLAAAQRGARQRPAAA